VLAAALLLVPGSARAQVRDSTARLERIGDGIFAIIHDDATDAWPHGNTGVVIGRDGGLVVDATYLPSRARADIELIGKVTDKPVRWLVITHWHFTTTAHPRTCRRSPASPWSASGRPGVGSR
jgi:alkyl sulfatase BDS1-like metallo-beta-lactamase superfamily hydrolase